MAVKGFKYSLTVLNTAVCLGIFSNIIYSIFNWEQLSSGEGWGVIAVIAIGLITASGVIIDLVLQLIFRNRKVLNVIGTLVVLAYIYVIFYMQ